MGPRHLAACLAWALTAPALLGCASSWTSRDVAAADAAAANVLVYVSNEGSPWVGLAVYVDGQVVARRGLPSLYTPTHHRSPEEIPLALSPGPHALRFVASDGTASPPAAIVVSKGTTYVSATYWPAERPPQPAPKVTVRVQDRPFGWC